MRTISSKTKLTLWVPTDTKKIGMQLARQYNESISQMVSNYLLRLKEIQEYFSKPAPMVNRLTGIIKSKKVNVKSYKKYLEKKYINPNA